MYKGIDFCPFKAIHGPGISIVSSICVCGCVCLQAHRMCSNL